MKRSLLLFAFVGVSQFMCAQNSSLTVKNLAYKWLLDQYEVLGFSESPSAEEKNDYLHLKPDMTFSSISEGILERGKWRLNAQKTRIYLSKEGEPGALVFIIKAVKQDQLILIIDDPDDFEAKYLEIHFKKQQ